MLRRSSLLVGLFALAATTASANVPLLTGFGGPRGYGTDCLSPNDDGSSASIDITPAFPSGLRFFTSTHTSAFVNTNGNITFSGAEPVFTPNAFPVASRPMIAAYWADVDLRPAVDGNCRGYPNGTSPGDEGCENPTSNGTWWKLEPGRMTITWDRVGYYSCNLDKLMDFQMVLTAAPPACGVEPGDFDVEFRFNTCDWTTGDASGGSNGFGGTPAQVGFDAGNEIDFVQIDGSLTSDINTIACTGSNIGEPGHWLFQIRGGTVQCPEAGGACDTGLDGVCAIGRTNCVGAGTECTAAVTPGVESCNALDDDCDGETDEGSLCGDNGSCVGGTCIVCGEIGCFGDDPACENVTCDAGLRCVEGACVDACAGITCPVGDECRAGRCIDACANIGCDECSVCDEGTCATRCVNDASCAAGESCLADGRCVAAACAAVTCDVGSYCDGGTCRDACEGAVCPEGQFCSAGSCVDGSEGEGEGEGEGGEGEGEGREGEGEGAEGEGEGEGSSSVTGCACSTSSAADVVGFAGVVGLTLVRRRRRR
jgi:MYXO-CTERM domain-containing protein